MKLSDWCNEHGEYGKKLLHEFAGVDEYGNDISIDDITHGSGKKVLWVCDKDINHMWLADPRHRTVVNRGCPYCSGLKVIRGENDFYTWCKEHGEYGETLLKQFNGIYYELDKRTIHDIKYGANIRVKWKCSNGHEWDTLLYTRTSRETQCPHCVTRGIKLEIGNNDLVSWCNKEGEFGKILLSQWTGIDSSGNNIDINSVSFGMTHEMVWKCSKNHSWIASINSRTYKKSLCPICNKAGTSFPEQVIYRYYKGIYGNTISRGKYKGYEFDVAIPELKACIEFSAEIWHSTEKRINRDLEKRELCRKHNVNLIEIIQTSNQNYNEVSEDKIIVGAFLRKYNDIKEMIRLINLKLNIEECVDDTLLKNAIRESINFMYDGDN